MEAAESEYRVVWRVRSSGHQGHGEPLNKALAEVWRDHGNLVYSGEIDHWIERVAR